MQVLKEDILEYMQKEHHGIREEDLMSHRAKPIGKVIIRPDFGCLRWGQRLSGRIRRFLDVGKPSVYSNEIIL